jgi:hypothetical protein
MIFWTIDPDVFNPICDNLRALARKFAFSSQELLPPTINRL